MSAPDAILHFRERLYKRLFSGILTVEVGGSSLQAVRFERPELGTVVPLSEHRSDPWLLAAPGLVEGDRVRGAHHLGWLDVQASRELSMASSPLLSMNDAEAAALGEWWLRGRLSGTLLYVGLGTGVGAVAIADGVLLPVEFSHLTAFGPKRCEGCGRAGCLDAQIGGHALPTPLHDGDVGAIVEALGAAISQQAIAVDRVVIGGGMARRYPSLVSRLRDRVEPAVAASACPASYKSAAPFGLLYAWQMR